MATKEISNKYQTLIYLGLKKIIVFSTDDWFIYLEDITKNGWFVFYILSDYTREMRY